jgi:periplasmic divalent cation tolerance protein
MHDDILVVYVTCADIDEARRIGRALVQDGLAACVNLRAHETLYRWEGNVEAGQEIGLLAKTVRDSYPALQARVCDLHSYELPCIIAWPLAAGLPAFCDWVRENAAGPEINPSGAGTSPA